MTVEGLSALQKRFRRMPQAVQKAARRTLEQNAVEIVGMMRRLVPVESGALRDSIGWTWGTAPKGAAIVGKVAASEDSVMSITIYAGDATTARLQSRPAKKGKAAPNAGGKFVANNARYQEFGTRKMQANPYFFPAIRALKDRAKSRMARNVKQAAREVFGG